jgi:hypothetical protein
VFIQVPRAFNNLFRTVDFWIRTSAARAGLQLISVSFQPLQSSCATVALTILGLLMPKPYGVTLPFDMGNNPFDKCPKQSPPESIRDRHNNLPAGDRSLGEKFCALRARPFFQPLGLLPAQTRAKGLHPLESHSPLKIAPH